MRIKPYECAPMSGWFSTWIQEQNDGREFRIAVLRLPSYQLRYAANCDRDTWQQLALCYHGNRGLSFKWFPADY